MNQRVWGKRETIDDLFASIQLGQPVYLWFREEREGREEYVVRRVVGDGGGTLWTDDRGYGMRVTLEMRARCCGRVWTPDEVQALQQASGGEVSVEGQADARETARFAVYDALCVLFGEAGWGQWISPERMDTWANQILESLVRADVAWAIGALVEADAALRMRVRKP